MQDVSQLPSIAFCLIQECLSLFPCLLIAYCPILTWQRGRTRWLVVKYISQILIFVIVIHKWSSNHWVRLSCSCCCIGHLMVAWPLACCHYVISGISHQTFHYWVSNCCLLTRLLKYLQCGNTNESHKKPVFSSQCLVETFVGFCHILCSVLQMSRVNRHWDILITINTLNIEIFYCLHVSHCYRNGGTWLL